MYSPYKADQKLNNNNENNTEINKLLNTVTRYVSKPLGFNKMYAEEQMERVKKRGKIFENEKAILI
jgi:hypothetical protein